MKNIGISKKTLALLLAVMLAVGCAVGGTVAWLLDTTDEVVNTFSVGNIDITLTETPNTDSTPDDDKAENDIWKAQIVPGYKYAKDPVVTVKANSEACWLFVEVSEPNINVTVGEGDSAETYTTSDFMQYTLNFNDWNKGDGTSIPANVYYKEIANSPFTHYILVGEGEGEFKNGYVTIPETVTKEMMDKLTETEYKLSFKAYAAQLYKNNSTKFSAKEAWDIVKPTQQ